MDIVNTKEQKTEQPPIQMVVYGEGGVGKTTFAANAPKAVIADCETGTKYLGSRGVDVDVAHIKNWKDFYDFTKLVKDSEHKTIVIDPIGELMDKLQQHMAATKGPKLVQQEDDSPTMAGWGWLKRTMRQSLKILRDSGKNLVIIAHVDEKEDEGRMIKRPLLQTKLSEELINMVDIVAYMTVTQHPDDPEKTKRVLVCDAQSDRFVAKDRTGKLDRVELPVWDDLLKKVNSEFWERKNNKSDPDEEVEDNPEPKPDPDEDESLESVTDEMQEDDDSEKSDSTDIELLELNAGAEKAMKAADITTVEKLMEHTKGELQQIKGIGDATVDEIVSILDEVGKSLKREDKKESTLTDRLKGQN